MANEISQIGVATHSAAPAYAGAVPPPATGRAGSAGPPAETPAVAPTERGSAGERYARLQSEKDRHFDDMVDIRQDGQKLDEIETHLGELRATLDSIVKQYPPYPRDDPRRIELLNQVIGLQKQIESLDVTFPWKDSADEGGPLLGGLTERPASAISDTELPALLDETQAAFGSVTAARGRLWADVVAITGAAGNSAEATAVAGASQAALARQSDQDVGIGITATRLAVLG